MALLRWRRSGVPDAVIVGRYLLLAGSIRFAIEFIRVNVRVLGPLTLAHLVSLALMVAGAVILVRSKTPGSVPRDVVSYRTAVGARVFREGEKDGNEKTLVRDAGSFR
jgi:prolipoprotein diacylglyceryltransferase